MKKERYDAWFFRRLFTFTGYLILGFIILIIIAQYKKWLLESNSFQIRKVEIVGNELFTDEELFEMGLIDPTNSIWKIDLTGAHNNIGSHVFIEDFHIDRVFPNVLRINVKEKTPVALLNVDGKLYCLDREGLVLPSKPGKLYDLPVISGDFRGTVAVGRMVSGKMVYQGLDFLNYILNDRPGLFSSISEVVMGKPEGIVLITSKAGVPVWLGQDGYFIKVRYLEAILNELNVKNELSQVKYIDLRFNNQIIVGMRA